MLRMPSSRDMWSSLTEYIETPAFLAAVHGCLLLSACGCIVLSVWGVMLINQSPYIDVAKDKKTSAGVCSILAAIMYAGVFILCQRYIKWFQQGALHDGTEYDTVELRAFGDDL